MHSAVNIGGIPTSREKRARCGATRPLWSTEPRGPGSSDQISPTAREATHMRATNTSSLPTAQGFHFAARRSICSGLGSISAVIGLPALTLPKVNRYPLRTPSSVPGKHAAVRLKMATSPPSTSRSRARGSAARQFRHPASAVLRRSSAPYRRGSWPRGRAAEEEPFPRESPAAHEPLLWHGQQ